MKMTWFAVAALLGGCCCVKAPSAADEAGFVPLFNGRDLDGWEGATSDYGVNPREPGVLQCWGKNDPLRPGEHRNLCTVRSYANFILRFDFWVPENGDNGLGIRITDPAADAAFSAMCEIQLLDDAGNLYSDPATGKRRLEDWRYAGSVFGIAAARHDDPKSEVRRNAWNSAEVRVIGDDIEVFFNGCLVTKANLAQFAGTGDTLDGRRHPGIRNRRGRIGWLGHDWKVKWRNIRLRELPDDARIGDF